MRWLFLLAMIAFGSPASAEKASKVSDGWQPTEQLIIGGKYGPVRRGKSPSGLHYEIDKEGSALLSPEPYDIVNGWWLRCATDAMSDRRSCAMISREFYIEFDDNGLASKICLSKHKYPGRRAMLRLDKTAPLTSDDGGCFNGAIAEQIGQAETITTRVITWPGGNKVDRTVPATQLREALSLAAHVQSGHATRKFGN